jgi:site-specific recombinase XerD
MDTISTAAPAEKKKKGTIRFEQRTEKEKIDKDGKAPVRLIYQVRGQRKYYNTGQKLLPESWDSKNQQAVYVDRKTAKKLHPAIDYDLLLTDSEAATLNGKLQDLQKLIDSIEQRFEMDKIIYSAEIVIDKLNEIEKPKTKKEAPSNILFDFIDKYIQDHTKTREPGSLIVYRSLKNHLQAYQQETKKKIAFDKIDYSFFQSFQNFLIGRTKTVKGKTFPMLNNTTIAKQLSTVKTFLNYAKKQGINVSDKYKDFKIKKDELEVIALTNEEFEKLFYFDLSNNKKLAQVRDIFCFACSTGLRYSDLDQLKRTHIKQDEIRLTVKKTKEKLTVPLTPYSIAILAKYEAQHRPLPMISNQKLNDYVKELCQLAGITEQVEIVRFRGIKREAITYPKYELIGVHTGRKTFATVSLEKGMSAEEVMAITGHKDYKSFQRYVKVTEQRKKTVMLKAWGGELSTVKLKAI